jgi:anti-sigma factor RsiW
MACRTIYLEQMSLHLDGLLDAGDERELLAHIGSCAECTALWGPMNEAHAMLIASALEPLEAPQGFSLRVMQRIAVMPVVRPQFELRPQRAMVAATGVSVIPGRLAAAFDRDTAGEHTPDYAGEWQHRVVTYVRGMAAVGLAFAVTAVALVSLVLTGALPVSAQVAPILETVRTFLAAGATWAGSLVQSIGANTVLGGGIVLGLLALAGWQLVANYHQTASDYHYYQVESPALEAA